MQKKKPEKGNTGDRLRKLENRLRKLKARVETLAARSGELSDGMAGFKKTARQLGEKVGDAGLLAAVKAREFANTSKSLDDRIGGLEADLLKVVRRTAQLAPGRTGSGSEQEPPGRFDEMNAALDALAHKTAAMEEAARGLTSRVQANEAGLRRLTEKADRGEQQLETVQSEQEALHGKIRQLNLLHGRLQEGYENLEQKSAGQAGEFGIRLDSLEQADSRHTSGIAELDEKNRATQTLIRSVEAAVAGQQGSLDELKTELDNVSSITFASEHRISRLEGAAQDQAAAVQGLKLETARHKEVREEVAAIGDRISQQAGGFDKRISELAKASQAEAARSELLESNAAKLERLFARLRSRSWMVAVTLLLGTAAVVFSFLDTRNDLRAAADVFSGRLAAIEQQVAGGRSNTEKSVIGELNQMNTSLAKLAALETRGWQQDADLKAIQQEVADLSNELTALQNSVEEKVLAVARLPGVDARGAGQRDEAAGPEPLVPSGADVLGVAQRPSVAGGALRRRYTIQLIGSYSRQSTSEFVRRNDLSGNARIVELENKHRPWYVLLYGSYPNYRLASDALRSLSDDVKRYNAWIRIMPATVHAD